MKKNVGEIDRYLRITLGLVMLGQGINRDSNLWMALGAMKVAEGITRYCPMLDMLGINTTKSHPQVMQKVRRTANRVTEDL